MKQLHWPLAGFDSIPQMIGATPRVQKTRYPVRHLRYWFVRSALADLHARLNRPLRVLEVGADHGDMLCFMTGRRIANDRFALPGWIARWDGLDVKIDPAVLERYSYSDFIKADIESAGAEWKRNGPYDAVVLLQVLEHLLDPERSMRLLLAAIEPGGLLMGGSPTMPSALAFVHEWQLRRKHAARLHDVSTHRHVSVITPGRIRRFARTENLRVDLLAGAFFLRLSGSPLENSAVWLRANLLWGGLFPALGGEIYFSLCTPEAGRSGMDVSS